VGAGARTRAQEDCADARREDDGDEQSHADDGEHGLEVRDKNHGFTLPEGYGLCTKWSAAVLDLFAQHNHYNTHWHNWLIGL
jgi:hypothetical protein